MLTFSHVIPARGSNTVGSEHETRRMPWLL